MRGVTNLNLFLSQCNTVNDVHSCCLIRLGISLILCLEYCMVFWANATDELALVCCIVRADVPCPTASWASNISNIGFRW